MLNILDTCRKIIQHSTNITADLEVLRFYSWITHFPVRHERAPDHAIGNAIDQLILDSGHARPHDTILTTGEISIIDSISTPLCYLVGNAHRRPIKTSLQTYLLLPRHAYRLMHTARGDANFA